MEIMDELIQDWLTNDTSDKGQYCNGLRVDTRDELTIKEEEIKNNKSVETFKDLEFVYIIPKEKEPTSGNTVIVLNDKWGTQEYEEVVRMTLNIGDKPGQIVYPESEKIEFPGHVFSGCYDENNNWVIGDTGWFSWNNDYIDENGNWKYNGDVVLYVGYNESEL